MKKKISRAKRAKNFLGTQHFGPPSKDFGGPKVLGNPPPLKRPKVLGIPNTLANLVW